jgi:hypothetical protein
VLCSAQRSPTRRSACIFSTCVKTGIQRQSKLVSLLFSSVGLFVFREKRTRTGGERVESNGGLGNFPRL